MYQAWVRQAGRAGFRFVKWDQARPDEMRGVEAGVELGDEIRGVQPSTSDEARGVQPSTSDEARGVQPSTPDEARGARQGWNYASRV